MKKSIISFVSLVMVTLFFTSCENTADDFMTSNAKTGGLVSATKSFPYKLGGTTSFDVSISIPKGPGIVSIDVYKTYTGKSKVLDQTINVASANATGDLTKSIKYTYATLSAGLQMPADEGQLTIGDSWTISYVSKMEDGRSVTNTGTTKVSVANKYAGNYKCVRTFTHPTAGVRAVNEDKYMTPISAYACWANAGDLGSSGYFVKIAVDPLTNLVTCSTWGDVEMANYPGEQNYYDPQTGKFHLSYFYVGGTGNRVMREVFTPIK